MKYQVYAALIASTKAQWADKINDSMPTEDETKTAEDKVEKWLSDFEVIVGEAKPAVQARNRRIKRAYIAHEKEEEEIFHDGVEDLMDAEEEYKEEVMHAQEEAIHAAENQGLMKEWEELVQEIQTEMDGCNMDMKKIRLSVKQLKAQHIAADATNLNMRQTFHEKAPSPHEVEDAEIIIKGWFERGERIMEDAKPGIEARDRRFMQAWDRAEKEEQEINQEMMDDLIAAQHDFEDEVMDAEHNFEEELHQNGVVADWEALEDKVEADMQAMKKFHDRVTLIKQRHQIMQRAQVKLNTNLAMISDEMAHNSPDPEEFDAIKVKVTDWMSRFESIEERARPIKARRDREVMDATEDRAEEMGETIEDMFEDWDKNDREFFEEVEAAEDAMLKRWETQGTTDKIEKLGQDIEDSLMACEQSMIKIKANLQMKKQMQIQNMTMSQKMEHGPDGDKVKKVFDTVTGWVKEAERIDANAQPAAQRRERALMDAFEDRHEEVVDVLMDADKAHKKKEERFWTDVMNAQHDFEVRMENEGIVARDKKLKSDIEEQFKKWEASMGKVNSATSLVAEQDVFQSLKALESEIDSVLATL